MTMDGVIVKKWKCNFILFQGMLFLLCGIWGCSFPTIILPEDYHMAQSESVGLYVQPSGDRAVDQVYPNILYLNLSTKGYNITNINMLTELKNVALPWLDHATLLDTLLKLKSMPKLRTIFIVHLERDSAKVYTDVQETEVVGGKNISYRMYTMPAIKSEYVGFDVATRKIIFSCGTVDTSCLYSRQEDYRFVEYPWMTVARQVAKTMEDVPICTIDNAGTGKYKYEIDLYVDKSYRTQYPNNWLNRLKTRMLFVNDIFQKQFDIEFSTFRFFTWDSEFDYSLDQTMGRFQQELPKQTKVIRLGITYNSQLRVNWTDKNKLGLASLLGTEAIVTAQPSFPRVTGWNSVEEMLTIAHELGHIFGAVHSQDTLSIMYYSAGTLSYQFDSISTETINHTKANFFQSGGRERVRNYMQAICNVRKSPLKNKCEVLRPLCSVLAQENNHAVSDSIQLMKSMNVLSSDTAVQLGIRGVYAYKEGRLERALQLFSRALNYQPDFSEAYWYLYKVLLREGKQKEAEEYLRLGQRYGMPRIEDEHTL
jgi:tetratricopeptide (TPR) repeat protein